MNQKSDGHNLNSVLLESNYQLKPIIIYARYEFIQKDAHELQLLQFPDDLIFNINVITIGLNKIIFSHKAGSISIGAQGALNFPGENLSSIYGDNPLAGQVYLKFSPPAGQNHGHK